MTPDLRVGLGFDLHGWGAARQLYLGGVLFDGEPGLAGHSDGDVVCHAVGDAMLGAAALGDLGMHFPDTDPGIEGIAGLDLLAQVVGILAKAGWAAHGCDLTVVADRPSISGRRDEIRRNLAEALSLELGSVSVKATRPEGLGLRGDGGCLAVATIALASSDT